LPGLHPVLARVFAARAVESAEDLSQSLDTLLSPSELKNIDAAADLLEKALLDNSRIVIVADFDADGATSCAVAIRSLRAFGHRDVQYVVPNRFEYGYGLTPEIVEVATQYDPKVLITVDNGISSNAGVAAARARGIQVIVTDHHLAGDTLPDANVIINPNQPGDTFPSKNLAGVGVIFYVMLSLRSRLRQSGWFNSSTRPEPNLGQFLDLVALGTVADVVPLDRNNRILVSQGLKRLNQRGACAGILALLEIGGRANRQWSAADLGFVVAPRLNAAGRLTDMSLGIECLCTDDPDRARTIADELDRLNRERRSIEADMQKQAVEAMETLHLNQGALPAGLCLLDPGWHQGVIGILAARVREMIHRPVIAFAPSGNGEIKGSARSVPGLHIRDALDAIAVRHPGLVTKFGGHAMAAGLTLNEGQFDAFSDAFALEVERQLNGADFAGEIATDGKIEDHYLTLGLAQQIRQAGPWGQGFPEPLFEGEFTVVTQRVVGDRHLKLNLRTDGGQLVDAIAFRVLDGGRAPPDWDRIRIAYRLDVNEFNGRSSLQLIVEHLEQAGVPGAHNLELPHATQDT